jgi:hypothetical protein
MALRPCSQAVRRPWAGDLQQAHIGLGLEHLQRLGREVGRHQHLDELLATCSAAAPSTGG